MSKTHRTTVAALAAALLALGLSACGEDASGKDPEAVTVTVTATPEPTESPSASEDGDGDVYEEGGSAEEMKTEGAVAVGETAAIGGWDVAVTKVVLNANGLVEQWDADYNDPPKDQYVAVYFDATYGGKKRIGDSTDLYWSLSTADGVVHDYTYEPWDISDEEEWPEETRAGGTVHDIVLFDVPAKKIAGGFLSVEDYNSGDWIDFQL